MNNTGGIEGKKPRPPAHDAPATRHRRMHLLMLGATFCWAANIVAGKEALRGFGALTLAQLRVTGAALVLGVLFLGWRRRPTLRMNARQWLFLIWVALFGITLNQLFFIGGLSRSSVAHTGLIVALGPVMVLVLSCLMHLEALTALKIVGMIVSFTGVGFLTLGKAGEVSGATMKGDLILLGGTAVFAYYTVLVKGVVEQYDPLTFNVLIFVLGAALMVPFTLRNILNIRWTLLPSIAWWGLTFMVLFGSVAAYLIFAFALRELTAARVAAFSYLQPAIATALGIWLLGETLTRGVVAGGVLILLGVYLTERERGEDEDKDKQVQGAAPGVA
ncbi:MAG TPA: DMT family transporter [Terriglobia bacterium]|nr:DMT family transporter [Terriglobia bacterium]